MKKLILFIIGITLLSSCTNDTDSINFNDSSTGANPEVPARIPKSAAVDPVLKSLYLKMIDSESYRSYESARVIFYEKVGDAIPDNELTSGASMLRWISNNIPLTGFQSYSEAQSGYNALLSLNSLSLQANHEFFEHLVGTAPGSLVPILEELEPEPTSCKACTTAFGNCMGSARHTYANAIEAASATWLYQGGSWDNYNSSVDSAISTYQRATSRCRNNFNQCCGGGSF